VGRRRPAGIVAGDVAPPRRRRREYARADGRGGHGDCRGDWRHPDLAVDVIGAECVAARDRAIGRYGRRAASRTLERAVGAAVARNRSGNDTRAFTDAVIELLPQSRTDVEHFDEVWR